MSEGLSELRDRGLLDPFMALGRDLATGRVRPEWLHDRLRRGVKALRAGGIEVSEGLEAELRELVEMERDFVVDPFEVLSFTGAATRLRERHERDLLWTPQRRLSWDERRWRTDELTVGEAWAHEIARLYLEDAERFSGQADAVENDEATPGLIANLEKYFGKREERQDPEHPWEKRTARRLRSRYGQLRSLYLRIETPHGLASVLKTASILHTIEERELDAEPFLLNTPTGTIELAQGIGREFRREERITKLTRAEFRQGLRNGEWEGFTDEVTGGDAEVRELLQLSAGYSATGSNREKVFFVLLGPPHGGKSTLLDAFGNALGDYAGPFDVKAFAQCKSSSGHEENLASLAGARFLFSNEVEEGLRIDGGRLKAWVSGDPMRVSLKGKPSFLMRPIGKLWLACNRMPPMDPGDVALWARCIVIPFEKTFAVSGMRERLLEDRDLQAAALAWIAEGARKYWQRVEADLPGLPVPQRIRDLVASERAMQNPLSAFFRSECIADPKSVTLVSVLHAAYSGFCASYGEEPVSDRKWGPHLRGLGLEPCSIGKGRGWKGVSLRRLSHPATSGDVGAERPSRTQGGRSPGPPTSPTSESQPSRTGEEQRA